MQIGIWKIYQRSLLQGVERQLDGGASAGNVAYLTPHLLSVGVDPILVTLVRSDVNSIFIRTIWIRLSTAIF